MSEARGLRRGIIRSRDLLRARREILRDAVHIIQGIEYSAASVTALQRSAAETDRCITSLDSVIERLPRLKGKKYR